MDLDSLYHFCFDDIFSVRFSSFLCVHCFPHFFSIGPHEQLISFLCFFLKNYILSLFISRLFLFSIKLFNNTCKISSKFVITCLYLFLIFPWSLPYSFNNILEFSTLFNTYALSISLRNPSQLFTLLSIVTFLTSFFF